MTIEGQVDLFESMGETAPIQPFTVYTCVWAEKGCGWCHSSGLDGGGACRNPRNKDESLFYSYCSKCRARYGYPRPGSPDYPVTIDRTQKARPGEAPNLTGRKELIPGGEGQEAVLHDDE